VAGYINMVYPETVNHPSINRTGRRVTQLIQTNALPPGHHPYHTSSLFYYLDVLVVRCGIF